MDFNCHECGEPQSVWMVARCTNPNRANTCGGEAFCFKCLGTTYPQLYGSIFKGLWWLCPVCSGLCKCETCTDPVKKAEYQRLSRRKQRQKPAPLPPHPYHPSHPSHHLEHQQVDQTTTTTPTTTTKLRLRSGTINKSKAAHPHPHPHHPPHVELPHHANQNQAPIIPEEQDNGWICSRCSTLNSNEDIECVACLSHRKRISRKRPSQEPVHEADADKFHTFKETRRATEINEDKVAPVKGRVSALRQLVKKPWADGWDQARRLALELVDEALHIGFKQGIPTDQLRQLPTKYQLANQRASHVRKWFDREPTLAKKFLRAADFVYSKSNGTFLKDHVKSMDELPRLIKEVDAAKLPESSESDDEGDSNIVPIPSPVPSSPVPPDSSPSITFHDLQVYYHQPKSDDVGPTSPLVFHMPITDLSTMQELHAKLNSSLQTLGASPPDKLTLRIEKDNSSSVDECTKIADLSHCSLLHVHATWQSPPSFSSPFVVY